MATRRNQMASVDALGAVGLKTAARLLHVIGDPAWHSKEERVRTVSELWAFCGLHTIDGHAVKRQRGVKANWSGDAKKRVYVIADGAIKHRCRPCRDAARSLQQTAEKLNGDTVAGTWSLPPLDCTCEQTHPYRHVYDSARAHGLEAVDAEGEPLSALHQHNRAVRRVMKALLRDLWRESVWLHGWGDEAWRDRYGQERAA
jgi:hypothetical protein